MPNKNDADAFLGKLSKTFGADFVSKASKCPQINRISSGSLELDIAMGGGFPTRRIILIYGPKSSAKSTIVSKACASSDRFCRVCKKDQMFCQCDKFSPGFGLYVDSEGTFIKSWAASLGTDLERLTVFTPECGEHAVDAVDTAIREKLFNVIVVDSLAACTPTHELEHSTETASMGQQARMLNRAFRKWNGSMISAGKEAPILFCINQPRESIGTMFGDSLTLPGGKGQWFFNSVELRLKTSKVHAAPGTTDNAYVEISGTVQKNKTYLPRQEFTFQLALRDYDNVRKGEINNVDSIVKHGRKLGLIKAYKGVWTLDLPDLDIKIEANGKEELAFEIKKDVSAYEIMYDYILKLALL